MGEGLLRQSGERSEPLGHTSASLFLPPPCHHRLVPPPPTSHWSESEREREKKKQLLLSHWCCVQQQRAGLSLSLTLSQSQSLRVTDYRDSDSLSAQSLCSGRQWSETRSQALWFIARCGCATNCVTAPCACAPTVRCWPASAAWRLEKFVAWCVVNR